MRRVRDGITLVGTASDYVLNVGGQCVVVSISRVKSAFGRNAGSIQIFGYNYVSSALDCDRHVHVLFFVICCMKHAFLKYKPIEQICIKSHARTSV